MFSGDHWENALHPGTRGKNWADRAERRALDKVAETYMREMGKTWGKVFK